MAAIVNARDVALQATSPRMVSVSLGSLLLPSLKRVSLTTPINLFQVTGGSATPTSMLLTATVIGILGDVTFSVVAGTATLTSVDEDSCVLLFSDMGTTSVTIRASITEGANTYTDDLTIIQVAPGYTGDRDEIIVYYTGDFVDGATTSALFASLTGLPTKIATDRINFQGAAGDDTRYRIAFDADEWVAATQFTDGNVGVSGTVFVKDRVIAGEAAFSRDVFVGQDLVVGGDLDILGVPRAPTAAPGTNTTQLATTAFVDAAVAAGGGGGGGGSLYGYFPGTTVSMSGNQKLFPNLTASITKISAWCTGAAPFDTTVTVRVNGASAGTATILGGTTSGDSGVVSVPIVSTDAITVDLTSAGAVNVGIRIDYA